MQVMRIPENPHTHTHKTFYSKMVSFYYTFYFSVLNGMHYFKCTMDFIQNELVALCTISVICFGIGMTPSLAHIYCLQSSRFLHFAQTNSFQCRFTFHYHMIEKPLLIEMFYFILFPQKKKRTPKKT